MTNYGKEQDSYISVGKAVLPDNVAYKRGNIFLIILGYCFAPIAGINGVMSIHDIFYNIFGDLCLGLIQRILNVVGIVLIYAMLHWALHYLITDEYKRDENGNYSLCRKYDKFTRVNYKIILLIFFLTAYVYGCMLQW